MSRVIALEPPSGVLCPVRGCGAMGSARFRLCLGCWARVPKALQDAVLAAERPGRFWRPDPPSKLPGGAVVLGGGGALSRRERLANLRKENPTRPIRAWRRAIEAAERAAGTALRRALRAGACRVSARVPDEPDCGYLAAADCHGFCERHWMMVPASLKKALLSCSGDDAAALLYKAERYALARSKPRRYVCPPPCGEVFWVEAWHVVRALETGKADLYCPNGCALEYDLAARRESRRIPPRPVAYGATREAEVILLWRPEEPEP